MGNFLDLTPQQMNQFDAITAKGTTNFANGYRYLYSILNTVPLSGDPARDRQLEDLKYWLRNAPDVNENNPDSAANQYIRAMTSSGLRWDGNNDRAQPVYLQNTSDTIAKNVIGDIRSVRGIPPLEDLVGRDINQALEGNKQTVGGWGGSAYYWNLPYTDAKGVTKTVGDRILSNPAELEKFISVNAAAILQMARDFHYTPYQTVLSLAAGTQAAVPEELKAAIVNRVLDVAHEGANIAGDTENIDGYKPIYSGPNDDVAGWERSLGDGGFQKVTDPSLIWQLSRRRQIRLDRGADTSWAEAPQPSEVPADNNIPWYRQNGWNRPNSAPEIAYGALPSTPLSANPYAYVTVPAADVMTKNALALYVQPAQAAPSGVNALNAYRPAASAGFGNASAPGIGNALIPQAGADAPADPYTATMLANMALMRAFGVAPSGGGASLDLPQQP